MAPLRPTKKAITPLAAIEIVSRRIRFYPVMLAELEEFTAPWFTVSLAVGGMCFGLLVAATVVLATIPLDTRQLVAFTIAATASTCGLVWSTVEAVRAYLRRRALLRELRRSGNGTESGTP